MAKIPSEKIIDAMEEMLNVASDSTRLKILYSLLPSKGKNSEKSVSDIIKDIGASQSLVSHQLRVLKDADLIGSRKEGTRVYYYLKDEHVYELIKVVYEHVCEK